jgi:hypothetical protein
MPIEAIAVVSLTNQTGTTQGTLYTPQETGLFRVTMMLQSTGGPGGQISGLNPYFTFVDDNGPEFYPAGTGQDGQALPPQTWSFVFKLKGGNPLIWNVQLAANDTSTYETYIVLEKIGTRMQ